MKLLGAMLVAFFSVAPVSAQYWSVGGFGNVAFPGLGHAPAGGHPYGNVVSPGSPQGAAAFSPGLIPGFRTGTGRGPGNGNRRGTSGIYAYPVYIGGSGYANGSGAEAAPGDQTQSNTAAPSQAPVVINQYFGTMPAADAPASETSATNYHFYQAPSNTDAAPPADTSYYLIAFKDHTVYSAVAYYTEADTLHYFTAGNVHNQASLSLVDRSLTEQLNRAHNVDVRLPQ